MYYYIYDNFVSERKYSKTIAQIEARLTDLGINGKITKMSILKNLKKTINEEISHGVKTLVVVGNDKTLSQTLNLLDDLDITIGFIPVGPNNNLAKLLGIKESETACDILSSRIITKLNLGLINDLVYFISYLELPGDDIYINCNDDFYINTEGKNNIIIISNIYFGEDEEKLKIKNNDNFFNLVIKNQEKSLFKAKKVTYSYFKAEKININSEKSVPILMIDEKRILKTPINLKLLRNKLNIIVGKNRILK